MRGASGDALEDDGLSEGEGADLPAGGFAARRAKRRRQDAEGVTMSLPSKMQQQTLQGASGCIGRPASGQVSQQADCGRGRRLRLEMSGPCSISAWQP